MSTENLIRELRASGDCDCQEFALARRAADVLEALVKERDAQGSCWDKGPTRPVRDGECAPEPPRCELPHGHGGAHREGRSEWMGRDSYNSVVAERDALAAVIQKAKLAPVQRVPNAVGLSGTVSDVLREAPTDVLSEHDAALIESLADEWAADPDAWGDNDKDYRNELRDRAQQIREGKTTP